MQKGFTLIEIIIAISIVAIFTVIPVLAYQNYLKGARDDKRKADLGKINVALQSYKAEKGEYPATLEDLVTEGFLAELPEDPLLGQELGDLDYGYSYASDGVNFTLSSLLEKDSSAGNSSNANCTINQGKANGTGTGSVTGSVLLYGNVTSGTMTGGTFYGSATGSTNGSVSGSATCTVGGGLSGEVSGMVSLNAATVSSAGELTGSLVGSVSQTSAKIYKIDPYNGGTLVQLTSAPQPTAFIATTTPFATPTTFAGNSPTPTPTQVLWVRRITNNGAKNGDGWNYTRLINKSALYNGFYYSVGSFWNKIYVTKLNSAGQVIWRKTYIGNGVTQQDGGGDIVAVTDGLVISGATRSMGDATNTNAFVMKINEAGSVVWTTVLDSNMDESFTDLKALSDGSVVVVGTTYQFWGTTGLDVLVAKINANGTVAWRRAIDVTTGVSDSHDRGVAIAPVNGGYIFGSYSGNGYGSLTYLLENGTISWTRGWSNANTPYGFELQQVTESEVVVSFAYGVTTGRSFFYLARVNTTPTFVWQTAYGIADNFQYHYIYDMRILGTDIYVGGAYGNGGRGYLSKYSTTDGAQAWERTYQHSPGIMGVVPSSNFIFTSGQRFNQGVTSSDDYWDPFYMKLASDGTISGCTEIDTSSQIDMVTQTTLGAPTSYTSTVVSNSPATVTTITTGTITVENDSTGTVTNVCR